MAIMYIVRVWEDGEKMEYEYGNYKHAMEHYEEEDKAEKVQLIEYIYYSDVNRSFERLIAEKGSF